MAKPNEKTSNRTAVLTAYLAALVVAVAWILKNEGGGNEKIALYTMLALGFLALPAAARHAVGDLALGVGTKGAWRVLTTDAKPPAAGAPGEPAP